MSTLLLNIFKKQNEIIDELIDLSEKLREALIKYDYKKINYITKLQELKSIELEKIEVKRIEIISNWLNIKITEARKITYSKIKDLLKDSEIDSSLNNLIESVNRLNTINSLNRVLANRARFTINEILSFFSDGKNYVCNVRI